MVMLLLSGMYAFLNVRIYKTNFLVYQVLKLFFTLNFTYQMTEACFIFIYYFIF